MPFAQVFPKAHPDSVALLDQLLAFDPRRRITVDKALLSEYLQEARR